MTGTAPFQLGDDNRFAFIPLGPDGRALQQDVGAAAANERDRWIVIAPIGARLHPNFKEIVLGQAAARPDIDLFYGDEVAFETERGGHCVSLKPALDLTYLIADDYIGFPLVVRASAIHELGGLRAAANTAACYDLVLRAISKGLGITRITEVLAAHQGAKPRPNVDDRLAALRAWLAESAHLFDVGNGLVPGTLALKRRFTSFPDVTLVIPTNQNLQTSVADATAGRPHIVNFLDSIARTDYPMDKIHVLVGDNFADDGIYSGQRWPFDFRRVLTPRYRGEGFNYAAKMNELWRAAETEHIVLMNDDIVVRSPGWLQALLTFSMQEDVGGVGARLLYANGTIQHAGMPGGLCDLCAHAWLGQSASAPTYQNWALVHREWSIVTGAVFATRKRVMEIINGFDDRFSLEFNDVDLCLRLRMLGYRIVYTPFAELIHYEKATRGQALPPGSELARFLKRWEEFLNDDPAYHPRLSRRTLDIQPVVGVGEWWQQYDGRSMESR